MQISHTIREGSYDVEAGKNNVKDVRYTYKNVTEVTFYTYLNWQCIYWAESRTGPKAYAFAEYPYNERPHVVVFESAGEMARFKEDLRLQEEAHARASKSS